MSVWTKGVRRTAIGVAAIGVIGAAFAAGFRLGGERVRARDAWADGRLLSLAIDSVRANALDSLPSDELIRRAVSGMLRELQDPYAALLRPDGFRSYRGTLMGESQGLGMSVRTQGQQMSIRRVVNGSPAAIAGVKRGDRILSWNGVSIADWRERSAADSARLRSDSARLVVWRPPFGDSLTITVRRATWHMPAVSETGLLSDSVGYVKLVTITQQSVKEFEQAVAMLERRGARQLVIDLRGNGGGLFEEGVKIAGLFLPEGSVVASLAGRGGGPNQVYRALESRWTTMPLTILVDAGTASAAEVIAAALREHQRALLIGAPTYGKGVVQRVVRLSPELSLRLTTARWLTPTGRLLERHVTKQGVASGGLLPDVRVDATSALDPYLIPRDWSTRATVRVIAIADSAVMQATSAGWSASPVSALEAQFRERLTTAIPRTLTTSRGMAQWLDVASRLATVRMLELQSQHEQILRYAMRDDTALRTALSIMAPPSSYVADASMETALPSVSRSPALPWSGRARQ